MTRCTSECVKPHIGTKIQHCKVCHRTFSSTSVGDKHRARTGGYTVVRFPGGKFLRIADGEEVPAGAKVMSVGNLVRACLPDAALLALGMQVNPRGVWTGAPPRDGRLLALR